MNKMSCIHIQSTAISVKNTKVAILFSVFSWMKLLYTQADTAKLIKLYSAQKIKWSSIVLSPIVWFNIVNTTHQTSIRCHVEFTNWFLNLSFSFHSFLFFEVKTLIEMSSFITCSGYYVIRKKDLLAHRVYSQIFWNVLQYQDICGVPTTLSHRILHELPKYHL